MVMENRTSGNALFITKDAIGREIAAVIDARDTYLNSKKIITHTIRAIRNTFGAIASITPEVVATPLPPLNFRKTVQTCPEMQATPISIDASSGFNKFLSILKIAGNSNTGANPFKASINKTINAGTFPISL